MRRHLTLLLGVLMLVQSSVLAQSPSITWVAQNLPPGLSVTRIDAQKAKVTGRATTPGVYDVVFFPMVGGIAGDMRRVKVTVLPGGLNLPQFYAYDRLLTTGSRGRPDFKSGGGGWFFGTVEQVGGFTAVFSANGQTFRGASLPTNCTQEVSAVTFGGTNNSTTIIAGKNPTNGSIIVTHRSLNQGAFQAIPAPPAPVSSNPYFTPSLYSFGLTCFGTRTVLVTYYAMPPSAPLLEIHSLEAGASEWVKRASLQDTNTSYFSSGPLQVSSAVIGTNTLLALRPSYYGSGVAPFLVRSSTSTGLSGWSLAANPHSIHSVAAGNGVVLGSSSRGVLRSSDGANWNWTYRRPVGPLVFSAAHNMFFSASGNSKEGEYWLDYALSGNFEMWQPTASTFGNVFANQTGAVIVNGRSLSTVFVPSPVSYASMAVNVGVDVALDLTPEN